MDRLELSDFANAFLAKPRTLGDVGMALKELLLIHPSLLSSRLSSFIDAHARDGLQSRELLPLPLPGKDEEELR